MPLIARDGTQMQLGWTDEEMRKMCPTTPLILPMAIMSNHIDRSIKDANADASLPPRLVQAAEEFCLLAARIEKIATENGHFDRRLVEVLSTDTKAVFPSDETELNSVVATIKGWSAQAHMIEALLLNGDPVAGKFDPSGVMTLHTSIVNVQDDEDGTCTPLPEMEMLIARVPHGKTEVMILPFISSIFHLDHVALRLALVIILHAREMLALPLRDVVKHPSSLPTPVQVAPLEEFPEGAELSNFAGMRGRGIRYMGDNVLLVQFPTKKVPVPCEYLYKRPHVYFFRSSGPFVQDLQPALLNGATPDVLHLVNSAQVEHVADKVIGAMRQALSESTSGHACLMGAFPKAHSSPRVPPRQSVALPDDYLKQLAALAAFIEKHSRCPSTKSDNPQENVLGLWIAAQDDAGSFGSAWSKKTEAQKIDAVDRLMRQYEEHNPKPSGSPNEDTCAYAARDGLMRQCLGSEDVQALERTLALIEKNRVEEFHKQLSSAIAFIKEHARPPSKKSGDAHEKTLALWIATQTKAFHGAGDEEPLRDAWRQFVQEHLSDSPFQPVRRRKGARARPDAAPAMSQAEKDAILAQLLKEEEEQVRASAQGMTKKSTRAAQRAYIARCEDWKPWSERIDATLLTAAVDGIGAEVSVGPFRLADKLVHVGLARDSPLGAQADSGELSARELAECLQTVWTASRGDRGALAAWYDKMTSATQLA